MRGAFLLFYFGNSELASFLQRNDANPDSFNRTKIVHDSVSTITSYVLLQYLMPSNVDGLARSNRAKTGGSRIPKGENEENKQEHQYKTHLTQQPVIKTNKRTNRN